VLGRSGMREAAWVVVAGRGSRQGAVVVVAVGGGDLYYLDGCRFLFQVERLPLPGLAPVVSGGSEASLVCAERGAVWWPPSARLVFPGENWEPRKIASRSESTLGGREDTSPRGNVSSGEAGPTLLRSWCYCRATARPLSAGRGGVRQGCGGCEAVPKDRAKRSPEQARPEGRRPSVLLA
jgi:hypothetical protein